MFHFPKGTRILSRIGSLVGYTTGAGYLCRLEGCRGMRITVNWGKGRHTHPCTKGLKPIDNGYQID